MADQEVIKHIKAAIDASRDKQKNIRHKIQEILMEVAIIVFAVSLSIWLHGWAEERKDHREEREFLIGLKTDLQADLAEMRSDLQSYVERRNMSHYFQRVGAGEKLNQDSANAYGWTFESWSTISPRSSRFEALRGSGKLGIIENKELLGRITELYTKDFPWINISNDMSRQVRLNGIMPYLAAHLIYDAQENGTNWEQVLRQPQMRVLMHQQFDFQDNLNAYKKGIDHCLKIIEEIDREVK